MGQPMAAVRMALAPRRVNDIAYVKACIERWAQWCGGSTIVRDSSPTGRLMDGVKSNVCPRWIDDVAARRPHDPYCELCQGKGRVKLDPSKPTTTFHRCTICDNDGKFLGDTCWRCQGTRQVQRIGLKVNPATIRGTRNAGGQSGADVVCLFINDLVNSWRESDATVWLSRVLVREYFYNNTQPVKAKQLRVSESFYKKRLADAFYLIEQMLDDKMP
jgi:hypothetical protein